jgi:dTDP-4-amino-4,6-dideoxygalactose transaminase
LDVVREVLDRGQFILGQELTAFEDEFCRFLGAPCGVGVGSGTDALTLALLAGEIQPGQEVLVPAFAPGAVATAVLACGATPVLAEVNDSYQLEENLLPALLTPRTRAVIVVHLYGKTTPMDRILDWAAENNLWVVEDCAHAHGAFHSSASSPRSVRAGMRGDVGAFSFYPTKNLGGIGDGGFCASRHPHLRKTLRRLRQYGWENRDFALSPGRNSRLDEIQAAILRIGLRHLDSRNARRQSLARRYREALLGQIPDHCVLPRTAPEDAPGVFHQFVARVSDRDRLREYLERRLIHCGIHYPFALHQQPAFGKLHGGRPLPVAERLAGSVLSLPLYPELRDEDCDRICHEIIQFWRSA